MSLQPGLYAYGPPWVQLGVGAIVTPPAPTPTPDPNPTPDPVPAYPPNYGVLGSYKPTAATTGRPAGSPALTVKTGVTTVSTNGAVYRDVKFMDRVNVSATDVLFQRCEFYGPANPTTGDFGFITCTANTVKRLVVEDCFFYPQTLNSRVQGACLGHDYTIRRCDISRAVDGLGIYNPTAGFQSGPVNVVVEGNYIHDLYFIRPEGGTLNRPEGTHNDGIQVQGGTGIRIFGNNIECLYDPALGSASIDPKVDATRGSPYYPEMGGTGAVTITPGNGATGDIVIEKNWLDGGGGTLTISQGGRGAIPGLVVRDNRFGHRARQDREAFINAATYDSMVRTGNVFEDGVGTPNFLRTANA